MVTLCCSFSMQKVVATEKQLLSDPFMMVSSSVDRPNVTVDDSGRYVCVAESNNVSVASQATLLEVYGEQLPSVIVLPLSNQVSL